MSPHRVFHPALEENTRCDALIVGGGITGSFVAERLTRQGLDVILVDREHPGRGSTTASTAMLLWEIDQSLTELAARYGFERATRAYRASFAAVGGLKSLIASLGIACDLRDRQSLYLAAGDTAQGLVEEHRLRSRAGLPGTFLDHAQLLDAHEVARAGAIVSPGSCDTDPVAMAYGLLQIATARGARLFDAEAIAFDAASRSVAVALDNGRQIEAGSVILATGYAMPDIVHTTLQKVSSSWAIATVPQPDNLWRDGALIWEDSDDYLYARTSAGGRIIIGGEDSDEVVATDARDDLIPVKSRILTDRLKALWPRGTRDRFPLGWHLRYHGRRPAAGRSRARPERHLCRLWLRRQRYHL